MIIDLAHSTHDRRADTRRERERWMSARKAEAHYARALRSVARQVDVFVRTMAPGPGDASASADLREALDKYASIIRPWATVTAKRMLADVSRRDEAVWAKMAAEMSSALRKEVQSAPTGIFLQGILRENVDLITSLPRDAGTRVHEWTLRGMEQGRRADDISREILRTGQVTKARADLIARTEVARTASGLTEARSVHVGSEGYIWRSSEDGDVRNTDGNPVGSHRLLNGKFIRWDSPPVASTDGTRAHAGQIYRCRCYPEPVIPDEPAAARH